MEEITATPTSFHTSDITPIILSESARKRVVFECTQVDNQNDLSKNIKGKLIIQKRPSDKTDFNDEEKFSLKDISAKERIEISLDTAETYMFAKGLTERYRVFTGKPTDPYNTRKYVEADEQYRLVKEFLKKDGNLLKLISDIDISDLSSSLSVANLRRICSQMRENLKNDDEIRFWQPFFTENSWILSQLFHCPVMFFNGMRYVGGKGLSNTGGEITDYIYKNDVTDNVATIEIKTPVKKFFSNSEYRAGICNFSSEFLGAISQTLKQKDTLIKEYYSLYHNSDGHFQANNIESILIFGNVSELSEEQISQLDIMRNDLKSVRIIGFDELLRKAEMMLELLANPVK